MAVAVSLVQAAERVLNASESIDCKRFSDNCSSGKAGTSHACWARSYSSCDSGDEVETG
jgi:hypothetical protein